MRWRLATWQTLMMIVHVEPKNIEARQVYVTLRCLL